MRRGPATALILAAALLCGPAGRVSGTPREILADPGRMITTARRMDFVGQNAFVTVRGEEGLVLRSTPQLSASGLYQRVNVVGTALGPVTWAWRVDRLQKSADLRDLAKEDAGAVIFFVFGEPTVGNKDVPTLAYAWTATKIANGQVLQSRRFKSLRYIQLRGRAEVGTWQRERRDIAADYRQAFGTAPPALVYVAVFNDNDQTEEPASALFGPIAWDR